MNLAKNNISFTPGSHEADATVWKALSRIQENWNLNNKEMATFLRIQPSTYLNWERNGRVPLGTKPFSANSEIIIAFIAIFRSLGAMFNSYKDQKIWMKTKHPFFCKSPYDYATESAANLFNLRSYLDYKRGRGA